LRLTRLQEAKDNLEAAMKHRTAIDVAVGVIMAQNRCSQDAAITILRKASNSRNAKLHDIATAVIASISPQPSLHTYFDE
jgi:AmiR/NasT family two-component response regulator